MISNILDTLRSSLKRLKSNFRDTILLTMSIKDSIINFTIIIVLLIYLFRVRLLIILPTNLIIKKLLLTNIYIFSYKPK